MKEYHLYLDESGSFEPKGTPNTGRASIVAGYLTEEPLGEAEALSCFAKCRRATRSMRRSAYSRSTGWKSVIPRSALSSETCCEQWSSVA